MARLWTRSTGHLPEEAHDVQRSRDGGAQDDPDIEHETDAAERKQRSVASDGADTTDDRTEWACRPGTRNAHQPDGRTIGRGQTNFRMKPKPKWRGQGRLVF